MASTKRCEGGETVHKAQGESQAAEGGLRPAHAGGKRGAGEKPVNPGGGRNVSAKSIRSALWPGSARWRGGRRRGTEAEIDQGPRAHEIKLLWGVSHVR